MGCKLTGLMFCFPLSVLSPAVLQLVCLTWGRSSLCARYAPARVADSDRPTNQTF